MAVTTIFRYRRSRDLSGKFRLGRGSETTPSARRHTVSTALGGGYCGLWLSLVHSQASWGQQHVPGAWGVRVFRHPLVLGRCPPREGTPAKNSVDWTPPDLVPP